MPLTQHKTDAYTIQQIVMRLLGVVLASVAAALVVTSTYNNLNPPMPWLLWLGLATIAWAVALSGFVSVRFQQD